MVGASVPLDTAGAANYDDGDVDGDGDVDLSDLPLLVTVYGTICE